MKYYSLLVKYNMFKFNMKEFNPKKVIVKYLANEATAIEEAELLNWVQSKENQKVFKEFIKAQHLSEVAYSTIDSESAFDDFLMKIHSTKNKKRHKFQMFAPYLKYAAVLIGVSLSLVYFMNKEDDASGFVVSKSEVSLQIINGDNEYFNIDTDKAVKTKDGVELAVVEHGVLKYPPNTQNKKNKNVQNILKVPYGKIFKVILSDGSSVHLNSGSILKYPSVFKENGTRTVFLEGEAFFSVSNLSSSAFIVNSHISSTKVFGTEFNVSSYIDDEKTEVVLVEGSVGVKINSSTIDQQSYTLVAPSQMASLSNNSKNFKITNVNIEKYIAWKNGDLFFQNDKFETIKKILERHYNVKIINHFTELNKFKYNGNFQNDSIEKILNTISMHTNFSFDRKGDTISINNPKKDNVNE